MTEPLISPGSTLKTGAAKIHRRQAGRLTFEVRRTVGSGLRFGATLGAIACGLFISAMALILSGVPAENLLNEFIVATIFDPGNLKSVLFQTAPLIFVGLCAAMAFRVRFWNLGIEGQMIFGAIGATFVAIFDIGPEQIRLLLMALAAMICGALWATIPAFLKLRLAVNEIISTLLLNYVASYFLLHLLYGPWKDKDGFPHSIQFSASELLPSFSSGFSSALLIAVVAVIFLTYLTLRSRLGIFMRFVSANPSVASALGVPVRGIVLSTVLLAGSLAALAGFVIVSGQEGRLTQSFFQGYGVSGVLIGFLARNNPIAAAIVAILMSVLMVAGQDLQVFYSIPQSMVQLIQAIIVISVAASDFLVVHRIHWVR